MADLFYHMKCKDKRMIVWMFISRIDEFDLFDLQVIYIWLVVLCSF